MKTQRVAAVTSIHGHQEVNANNRLLSRWGLLNSQSICSPLRYYGNAIPKISESAATLTLSPARPGPVLCGSARLGPARLNIHEGSVGRLIME